MVVHHDVTERRRAEERAWHRALHDPLTGLAKHSLGERTVRTGASAGIALCPAHGLDPERLIAAADAALYDAKAQRGGQVVIHRAGRRKSSHADRVA